MARQTVLGSPAAYARQLLRQHLVASAMVAAAVTVVAVVALAAAAGRVPAAELIAGVSLPLRAGGAFAAAAFVVGRAGRRRRGQLLAGITAETQVAKALRRAGAAAVVHGARPGAVGGDIDHVAIGPYVAAIETKHGRGPVRIVGRTGIEVGGRRMPRDPLGQAAKAAHRVARATGLRPTPVLCITRMSGGPFQHGDVWVCSAADLPAVLGRLPAQVDPARAADVARRLHDASTPATEERRRAA